MTKDQIELLRPGFEAAIIDRFKESGFLEVEIRVECLSRTGDALIIGTGRGDLEPFSPSTDWSQGGPLLAKHAIGFVGHDPINWLAFAAPCDETHQGLGPTHLIAACRLIVAANAGVTVSVPAEELE